MQQEQQGQAGSQVPSSLSTAACRLLRAGLPVTWHMTRPLWCPAAGVREAGTGLGPDVLDAFLRGDPRPDTEGPVLRMACRTGLERAWIPEGSGCCCMLGTYGARREEWTTAAMTKRQWCLGVGTHPHGPLMCHPGRASDTCWVHDAFRVFPPHQLPPALGPLPPTCQSQGTAVPRTPATLTPVPHNRWGHQTPPGDACAPPAARGHA